MANRKKNQERERERERERDGSKINKYEREKEKRWTLAKMVNLKEKSEVWRETLKMKEKMNGGSRRKNKCYQKLSGKPISL